MSAPDPIPDLLKAVNEASRTAFALWITLLSVGTYLAVSIGTTTHLQLLLAGPMKLPLLGVDLPLPLFAGCYGQELPEPVGGTDHFAPAWPLSWSVVPP